MGHGWHFGTLNKQRVVRGFDIIWDIVLLVLTYQDIWKVICPKSPHVHGMIVRKMWSYPPIIRRTNVGQALTTHTSLIKGVEVHALS